MDEDEEEDKVEVEEEDEVEGYFKLRFINSINSSAIIILFFIQLINLSSFFPIPILPLPLP
jgi:hypothetical protein